MTRLTMTAGLGAPLRGSRDKSRNRRPLADLAVALFDGIGSWSERAEQRRTLASASDQVLHDIGLSRLDAEAEAEKPFWKR